MWFNIPPTHRSYREGALHMRDRACFVQRDNPLALARGLSTVQAHNHALSYLYHNISSVYLAHHRVSHAKD